MNVRAAGSAGQHTPGAFILKIFSKKILNIDLTDQKKGFSKLLNFLSLITFHKWRKKVSKHNIYAQIVYFTDKLLYFLVLIKFDNSKSIY